MAQGEVSRAHVDVAVRAFAKLPRVLKTKTVRVDGVEEPGAWFVDRIITREGRVTEIV